MSSSRTKAFFWLSTSPLFFVLGAVAWAMIYSSHLTHAGHETYFVIFHIPWVPLLIVSPSLLLSGLVSLFLDKRNDKRNSEIK